MTDLHFSTLHLPGGALGAENPLPGLFDGQDLHAAIAAAPDVPEEERRYLGFGRVSGCLPYREQDTYDRIRRPSALRTAVLENRYLRATFLPDLGGRLWSLVHLPTNRELLYSNPVFQPANLAIRNAWFSGGVEWNIGMIGHGPFTCAPMFTARLQADDGTPVLRFYEWERIRQAPYMIDALLPDNSPLLYIRVQIVNPHDDTVPMYWWSNIAVPETPATRILVPADSALQYGYEAKLNIVPIPHYREVDISYPATIPQCMDFFFRLPAGQRPWIAALEADGSGLVQTSTSRLRGRKLFVWGQATDGKRWQDFLSEPGHPYLEIQAGLGRTQMECLPMPARATWSWTEAYGLLQADPALTHGPDWAAAHGEVEQRLHAMLTPDALDAFHAHITPLADCPPDKIVYHGSGWGALEDQRRANAGETPLPSGCPFPADASGDAQRPWQALLETGTLPAASSLDTPGDWMVQDDWRDLLEDALASGRGDHWLSWLHLGVMRCYAGDEDDARDAWKLSLARLRTCWALRNLAVLAQHQGHLDEAADYWVEAHRLAPALPQLLVECGKALLAAQRPQEWLSLVAGLPEPLALLGRTRYLAARASLMCGDLATVERFFTNALLLTDLREGEGSLLDLWYTYQAHRLAAAENIPLDDALRARVRKECPPPEGVL